MVIRKQLHQKRKEMRAAAQLKKVARKGTKVLDEWQTIYRILNGCSISRYGDGEFKHMEGKRNVSQVFFPELQLAIREVFYSNIPNHMVAIPNVFNGRAFTEVDEAYINNMRRRFGRITEVGKVYGSSYITRGDLCGYIGWPSYWALITEIWKDKDVVLVRGHEGRANTNMMQQARSLRQIEIPSSHAWRKYNEIMDECLRSPKESLYLICAGPTATVLAADLAKTGRHSVDLGHLGLFYRRYWGTECFEDRQVWHHRPTDPGYIKGITDQPDYIPPEEMAC